MILKRHSQAWLAKNFVARDFDCPCGYCDETVVDEQLVAKLQEIRDRIGAPVFVSKGGGYRCSGYQEFLRRKGYETSKGPSQHELGRAADITCLGLNGNDLATFAQEVGFKAIGVGARFIHVDLREDEERRWSYKT